jgi:hypothetical protein
MSVAVRNRVVAGALFLFGATMFCVPLFFTKTTPNLTKKDGPLSGQATIRGAYLNVGSRDVGLDRPLKEMVIVANPSVDIFYFFFQEAEERNKEARSKQS